MFKNFFDVKAGNNLKLTDTECYDAIIPVMDVNLGDTMNKSHNLSVPTDTVK